MSLSEREPLAAPGGGAWRNAPSAAANRTLFAERLLGPVRRRLRLMTGEAAFLSTLADAFDVVEPMVRDRSVALVGNAASLLQRPRPEIDGHDVVIRINRGAHVAEAAGSIGRRTDVVLVAGARMAIAVQRDAALLRSPPRAIVFMSSDRLTLPRRVCERMSFYRLDWARALETRIGQRPSSGAGGIDLVLRGLGTGELHLYGFDFWRTNTTYNDRLKVGPHSPSGEEAYARAVIPAGRIH